VRVYPRQSAQGKARSAQRAVDVSRATIAALSHLPLIEALLLPKTSPGLHCGPAPVPGARSTCLLLLFLSCLLIAGFQASSRVGICATALKRACRRYCRRRGCVRGKGRK